MSYIPNFDMLYNLSTDVEDVNTTVTKSPDITIKKKRGRPRKNSPLEIKIESSSTSTESTCDPTERKGRFIKNEVVESDLEMEETVMSTSSRGRKRRELDYSVLDSDSSVSIDDQPTKKRKKIHMILPHKTKCAKGDVSREMDESDPLEINSIVDTGEGAGNVEITNQNKSRYSFTGNTTKMLKQVFQAAQGTSKECSDDSFGVKENDRENNSDIKSPAEGGPVICMVCNQTIDWSEWSYHKQKIHHNLAWRNGETPIDIHNFKVVMATLRNLLKQQNKLKCHRCGEKSTLAKKFYDHLELCTGAVTATGKVTCAVCKKVLTKQEWPYHKYKLHNNLAWRVGDIPLDLNDQDLVMRILNQLYKSKKPLNCEKCGASKKSVVGYLSHKSTCQKSDQELEEVKVQCKLCFKKLLPVSLEYHLKTSHAPPKANQLDERDWTSANTDQGDLKRRAAQKALQMINKYGRNICADDIETKYFTHEDFKSASISTVLAQQVENASTITCKFPECIYTDTSVESLAVHMDSCNKKPSQFFACKKCISIFEQESEILKHLHAEHGMNIDENFEISDDELLEDNAEYFKLFMMEEKKKLQKNACYKVTPNFLLGLGNRSEKQGVYPFSYDWMLEFYENNCSNRQLFPNLKNDKGWQLLECDLLAQYLPQTQTSCYVAAKTLTGKNNSEGLEDCLFKRIDLFQPVELCEDDTTIFCGGPINAMAWLPTPFNEPDHRQILAVASFGSMTEKYLIDANYNCQSLILLWDFGVLKNKESKLVPSLLYGLGIDEGPIWDLEWCPSGCFDTSNGPSKNRLGLLAVAASDSFVHIFSVHNLLEEDRGMFYKGTSIIKLQLNSGNVAEVDKYYPVKLSWSKAAGHRYIAVGYSNGMVGMFDLNCESSLLRRTSINGDEIIFSYLAIQAHRSNITGLTLSHLNGGNRWLATSSFDRETIWWDLTTLDKTSFQRSTPLNDCVWLTHWLCCAIAEDESCSSAKRFYSLAKPIRDFISEPATLTVSKSGIKCLSFSDWLNGIVHGSLMGEIMSVFPNQMLRSMESRRNKFKKSLLSYARIVAKADIQGNVVEDICSYEHTINNYALCLLDYRLEDPGNFPIVNTEVVDSDKFANSWTEIYPLSSINKISFNSNPQACSYFAVGYQAGFLRLKHLSFLKNEKHLL
ncbi:uncharacterized protein LOC132703441 isoform X2 [Cylas formicarius]|uniref:uncharacterized protein LOC132703441 isoform X2 n=1 Tax=Cylas formicarius TaxID=197179 RepID=UPI0029585B9F|nr:uncharacterized protein LOC132703441 isoform X2 [Cylas formicarius]